MTSVTSPAAGGDERGLVARGSPPMITIRATTGATLTRVAALLPADPITRVATPLPSSNLRLCPLPIYAAYGSNMHPEQMLERAPHSPMAGTGWLHGWRLTFAGEDIGWEGALATLVEDPDSSVFVVLYDMTPADEERP